MVEVGAVPAHRQARHGMAVSDVAQLHDGQRRHFGVRPPEVVTGEEQIEIEVDRQRQQLAGRSGVDTGEGFVEGDQARGVGTGCFEVSGGRREEREVQDRGPLPAGVLVEESLGELALLAVSFAELHAWRF